MTVLEMAPGLHDEAPPAPPVRRSLAVQLAYPPRLLEWIMSLALVTIGALLALCPHTATIGGLRLGADLGFPVATCSAVFAVAGAARAAALFHNGSWPWGGPLLRAAGAAIGGLAWVQIAYGVLVAALGHDQAPADAVTYGVLTLGEIVSCYRACADVRPKPH